jgi:hypothetical protein
MTANITIVAPRPPGHLRLGNDHGADYPRDIFARQTEKDPQHVSFMTQGFDAECVC